MKHHLVPDALQDNLLLCCFKFEYMSEENPRNNLADIERWIEAAPDPTTFRSNDDFMSFPSS